MLESLYSLYRIIQSVLFTHYGLEVYPDERRVTWVIKQRRWFPFPYKEEKRKIYYKKRKCEKWNEIDEQILENYSEEYKNCKDDKQIFFIRINPKINERDTDLNIRPEILTEAQFMNMTQSIRSEA